MIRLDGLRRELNQVKTLHYLSFSVKERLIKYYEHEIAALEISEKIEEA